MRDLIKKIHMQVTPELIKLMKENELVIIMDKRFEVLRGRNFGKMLLTDITVDFQEIEVEKVFAGQRIVKILVFHFSLEELSFSLYLPFEQYDIFLFGEVYFNKNNKFTYEDDGYLRIKMKESNFYNEIERILEDLLKKEVNAIKNGLARVDSIKLLHHFLKKYEQQLIKRFVEKTKTFLPNPIKIENIMSGYPILYFVDEQKKQQKITVKLLEIL